MNLIRVTAPVGEPLFLDEVKQHLRYEGSDQDALIYGLIRSTHLALDGPQAQLKRALMTQTWDLKIDNQGDWGPREGWLDTGQWDRRRGFRPYIELPLPPLQAVTFIKFFDSDDAEQTFAAPSYQVVGVGGSRPGYITPVRTATWPAMRYTPEAMTVRFVCGYGDANDVPDPIREAMLRIIAHRFENRELGIYGVGSWKELPDVQDLLWPYTVIGGSDA